MLSKVYILCKKYKNINPSSFLIECLHMSISYVRQKYLCLVSFREYFFWKIACVWMSVSFMYQFTKYSSNCNFTLKLSFRWVVRFKILTPSRTGFEVAPLELSREWHHSQDKVEPLRGCLNSVPRQCSPGPRLQDTAWDIPISHLGPKLGYHGYFVITINIKVRSLHSSEPFSAALSFPFQIFLLFQPGSIAM